MEGEHQQMGSWGVLEIAASISRNHQDYLSQQPPLGMVSQSWSGQCASFSIQYTRIALAAKCCGSYIVYLCYRSC